MLSFKKSLNSISGIIILTLILAVLSCINFISPENIFSHIFSAAFAFLIMFIVPIFVIKIGLKKELSNFGFRTPVNFKEAIILTIFLFLFITPFLFVFSNQLDFQNYYLSGGLSSANFIFLAILLPLFYFLAEEFLFRGFFFFSLFRKIGVHSFWVVSLVFVLFHLTKPLPEILFSFFVSILFCYLSYRTKSFLPAFVVHFLMSVLMNGLIIFT